MGGSHRILFDTLVPFNPQSVYNQIKEESNQRAVCSFSELPTSENVRVLLKQEQRRGRGSSDSPGPIKEQQRLGAGGSRACEQSVPDAL